jgi:hypothetical protein
MAHLGTTLSFSTAFHPCTDGLSERTNQTVEQMLRGFVNARQDNWVKLLPVVEFAYNDRLHASTGTTPFYLQYGFHPFAPVDIALQRPVVSVPAQDRWNEHTAALKLAQHSIRTAQNKQKSAFDKHRRELTLAIGQYVLLSTKNISWPADVTRKLVPRFLGPFPITEVVSPVNYKLDLPPTLPIHNTFHVSLLKPWHEPRAEQFPLERDSQNHPPPIYPEDTQFEVEAIIAGPIIRGKPPKRKNAKRLHWYKIRWQGYGREHDQWVREDNISPMLLAAYNQHQQSA